LREDSKGAACKPPRSRNMTESSSGRQVQERKICTCRPFFFRSRRDAKHNLVDIARRGHNPLRAPTIMEKSVGSPMDFLSSDSLIRSSA
jgi:hypothetical protein